MMPDETSDIDSLSTSAEQQLVARCFRRNFTAHLLDGVFIVAAFAG
jgi:hypothetical protein